MFDPFATEKQQTLRLHYQSHFVTNYLTKFLLSLLPKNLDTIVVVCIGTDRSTGDALGPLVGSMLQQRRLKRLSVFGNLHDPVHALNLANKITIINEKYNDPFIIAIDAALGKANSIGQFICGIGSIQPGAALGKDLPAIGNIYLSGVVNMNSSANYFILQSTRLSMVYDMASIIANCLYRVDLFYEKETQSFSLLKQLQNKYKNNDDK